MEHQDWTPVTIGKRKADPSIVPSRLPGTTTTMGRGGTGNVIAGRKYKEDEFGMPITKGLKKGFGKVIEQARAAKGLTQKELAVKIGEKIQVVKDYETESVLNVNHAVIKKMEKFLGPLSTK